MEPNAIVHPGSLETSYAPASTLAARVREWLPRGGVLADAEWAIRHRTIRTLLIVQSLALFVFGIVRGEDPIHVLLEVSVPLACAGLANVGSSRDFKAVIASFGLVVTSGIFVHFSGGTIEAHFHFFIMLAVISLYQEWRAFLLTILFVALHHGTVGILDPESVYNHPAAQRDPWTWAVIHALLVLAESVALIAWWRFSEQAHDRAVSSKNELLEEQRRHLAEQAATEAKVRIQEARLKEAQAIAHIGNWDWDLQTNEVIGSDELFRIFGVDPADFDPTYENFMALIHEEDRAFAEETIRRSIENNEPYSIEFRLARPDGSTLKVLASGKAILDEDGAAARLVGIIQDVTERKSLEEQFLHAQKMEAVGHLAGGVAHDFNNLLSVVINYGSMLREDITDDAQREDVQEILKAANQGARLTRQLLNFARKEVSSTEAISLGDVLGDLTILLERTLGESCKLEVSAPDDLWPVEIDRTQIEQILMNLAVNARDAMPRGGSLSLRLENLRNATGSTKPTGEWVCISLADTGAGMSKETLEHVFEPFFTTKPRERGSGLGLATVYGIVERAGGHITVESQLGRGTRFEILLPRSTSEPAPAKKLTGDTQPKGSGKILIAEDREPVAYVTRRILERAGYEVTIAEDGAKGLRCVMEDPAIDLVISDVIMPNMSGPEMAEQIRLNRPETKIILMSGYTDGAIEPAALRNGDAFLQKPFEPQELIALVRKVLDEKTLLPH